MQIQFTQTINESFDTCQVNLLALLSQSPVKIKHSTINDIPTYIQIVSYQHQQHMSITADSNFHKASWTPSSENLARLQIVLKAA